MRASKVDSRSERLRNCGSWEWLVSLLVLQRWVGGDVESEWEAESGEEVRMVVSSFSFPILR